MENERYCKLCKRHLKQQNPGALCIICQNKITKSFDDKPYYDIEDIKRVLGLESNEQVRRLGRAGKIPGRIPGVKGHRYLKTVVDNWVESDHIFLRINPKPIGPLQEEAYRLCQQGDHSWMRDERFLGQACTSEDSAEILDNKMPMSTDVQVLFLQT
jgi:hypothetical protein